MTKQEKIREGVERILDELLFSPGESEDGYTFNLTGCITNLLKYLQSQGVVIQGQSLGGSHPHLANYYTVESLIKEEK